MRLAVILGLVLSLVSAADFGIKVNDPMIRKKY